MNIIWIAEDLINSAESAKKVISSTNELLVEVRKDFYSIKKIGVIKLGERIEVNPKISRRETCN